MKLLAPALLRVSFGAFALAFGASVMAQTETLRIQDYPGLGNMIVRVAAANGYCEKSGLNCELKTIHAGPLGIQALMAGVHTETPNAAKGYPAVMADLKGKKIGVTARGSGAEFQLLDMLKGAGLSGSDVTIVPAGALLEVQLDYPKDVVVCYDPVGCGLGERVMITIGAPAAWWFAPAHPRVVADALVIASLDNYDTPTPMR